MNTICMHTPSATGGHPLYVQELMTALARRAGSDTRVELVASVDLEERFVATEYPVHRVLPRLRPKSEFGNRCAWAANRIAYYPYREWCFLNWLGSRPDITAMHFQEFNVWMPPLLRAIRRMGKKIFYTAHYIRPHAYPPLLPHAVWNARHRLACRLCDGLFVLSEQVRDELAEFLGPAHPPIEVAPHGVWTIGQPLVRPALAERFKQKRLLFFGTMRRNKGLDLVLEAMPQLPDFQLTIAGAPREADYFYNEIMPKVRLLGVRGAKIEVLDRFINDEETAWLFASHSAILLPYTQEFTGQSGVIFLALAHEIPVVCRGVSGLNDIVADFQIGANFSEPTANALATAVRKLFADGQSAALAENIRQAREHFSWDATARATLRGYSRAFQEDCTAHDCRVATIS